MSLRHGLIALALLALAALTVACPVAIDEDELAATPGASPPAGEPLTPPATAEMPSPVAGATEDASDCGDATPEPRLEAPVEVASPPPYDPIPFVPDAELESRLRAVLAEAERQADEPDDEEDEEDGGAYSVVVKNLADGSGARIGADHEYYAASLFKVAVMYEAFHQRSQGLLSFDEEMLITPYYAGFDLGTRAFPVCSTVTVEQALAAMMSVSDNTSAVMLQDKVGAGHINESMEALGLTTTRLLEDDLPATAADMALLMEVIARGDASEQMLGLLASEEIDNGLRAGVPARPEGGAGGTLVPHKTGKWLNATHDVGIVYSPAATYVVAVLSDKGFEEDADVVITELSRSVWEYYNAGGRLGGRG